MKKVLIASTICILGHLVSTISSGQELPTDAKTLMNQLAQFEDQAANQAAEQIEAARKQAALMLEPKMRQATQAGDLDAAIAIKEEIERLQKPVSVKVTHAQVTAKESGSSQTEAPMPTSAPSSLSEARQIGSRETLMERLGGTIWKRGSGNYGRIFEDGLMKTYHFPTKKITEGRPVKQIGPLELEITWNSGKKTIFKFNRDLTEAQTPHTKLERVD